jgi:hypothetical protein
MLILQLNARTIPDRTTAATRVTMTTGVVVVEVVHGTTNTAVVVVVVDGITIVVGTVITIGNENGEGMEDATMTVATTIGGIERVAFVKNDTSLPPM